MGGESLSQEQIDALFRGLAGGDSNNASDPKPESDDKKDSADDDK